MSSSILSNDSFHTYINLENCLKGQVDNFVKTSEVQCDVEEVELKIESRSIDVKEKGTCTRTIIPDIKKFNYSKNVQMTADIIYKNIIDCNTTEDKDYIRRGNKRWMLIYHCVIHAMAQCGERPVPIKVAKEMGLTKGQAKRSYSLYSPMKLNYKPEVELNSSLHDHYRLYAKNKNVNMADEFIEELIAFSDSIISKDPSLSQKSPVTLCGGIFYSFITLHGYKITSQQLSDITGNSHATDKSIRDYVAIVYSS